MHRPGSSSRSVPTLIRVATIEDATFIAQFQIAMARETENRRLDPQTVDTAVRAVLQDPSRGFYLVNEVDGRVAGSLMITREWSDWRNTDIWYIQSVYVIPEERGKGVFRHLFDHVMNLAEQQQVKLVRLYVETENERAQSTYESLGMKRLPYYMYQIVVPPNGESEFQPVPETRDKSMDDAV